MLRLIDDGKSGRGSNSVVVSLLITTPNDVESRLYKWKSFSLIYTSAAESPRRALAGSQNEASHLKRGTKVVVAEWRSASHQPPLASPVTKSCFGMRCGTETLTS